MNKVSKERKKEVNDRLKAYRKKKYPVIMAEYASGITDWKEGVLYNIVYNIEDSQLEIFNNLNEASLPMGRIKNITAMNEKEIKEYEKNRVGSGLVAGVLINPLAGLLVGTNKKTKKKTKFHPFLIVEFEDKEGNPNALAFKIPFNGTNTTYFNKFLKKINPYLPKIEEEIQSKVEL